MNTELFLYYIRYSLLKSESSLYIIFTYLQKIYILFEMLNHDVS
jgi:hypothetical protein